MNEKKRLTISLSENIYSILDDLAKKKGLSKSAVISIAVEEYKKGQK